MAMENENMFRAVYIGCRVLAYGPVVTRTWSFWIANSAEYCLPSARWVHATSRIEDAAPITPSQRSQEGIASRDQEVQGTASM